MRIPIDTIEQAIAGDREAVGILYEQYKAVVLNWIIPVCPQTAEELCQDVFVKLFECIHMLREPITFHRWLRQLTRNIVADHVKKCKPTVVSPEFISDLDAKDAFIDGDTPLGNLLEEERDAEVLAAFNSLSEQDRGILSMFHVNGLKQSLIAKLLGIPLGTVKQRLHYARKRFKRALDE